jgi:hypothetical protein
MDIVLKIVSGLIAIYGIFILYTSFLRRFDHLGMALAGIICFAGGNLSFYLNSWWIVLTTIVLVFITQKIFGEPDYGRSPDYGFVLSEKEVTDNKKVGEFILKFLKIDPIGKQLMNEDFQKLTSLGFLYRFSSELKLDEPVTNNLVPWFMVYMLPKIQSLPHYSQNDFNNLVIKKSDESGDYLEALYQIVKEYDIKKEELYTSEFLNHLSDEDRVNAEYVMFAENIINTELRILQYLYSWWYPVDEKAVIQ